MSERCAARAARACAAASEAAARARERRSGAARGALGVRPRLATAVERRRLAGERRALHAAPSGRKICRQHVFFLQWQETDHTFQWRQKKFFGANSDESIRRRRGAVDGRIGKGRITRLNALGRHLLLELFDCDSDAINNLEFVKAALVEAAKRAQATIVDVVFHEFNPFGVSGVVVIAESHLSIHTWPEYRYAAVDIFSCG
ncbi:MAG: adenosylmethionine decarboxylase, partial [Candidatus Rokuibacteriota bacterium]